MKNTILLSVGLMASLVGLCQQENQVARKIAQKLKDSLSLTSNQQQQLYVINVRLHEEKMKAREEGSAADFIRKNIQVVENTRDSLYRPILTEQQFLQYREKKRNLVSNN